MNVQNNVLFFPQAIYLRYLTVIDGIRFTRREVDVIACLLHARSTSKISSLLNIAPTTVITHLKNIKEKLKCSSREKIIDFAEGSRNLTLIKKYYINVVIHSAFKKSLKDCSKLIDKSASSLIVYYNDQQCQCTLLYYLRTHLKLAGIEAEDQLQKPHAHQEENLKSTQSTLMIILKKEESADFSQTSNEFILVDFSNQERYCFSVFEVLKKLYPRVNFEPIILKFKKICEMMANTGKIFSTEEYLSGPTLEKAENDFLSNTLHRKEKPRETNQGNEKIRRAAVQLIQIVSGLKKRTLYLLALLFIGFIGIGALVLQKVSEKKQLQTLLSLPSIHSDLVIPKDATFLYRPDLIAKVDEKFKTSERAQVIALIGPGGAGKTILARHYARTQDAPVVWEISAESKESLMSSYEDLAEALAKEEADKKRLRAINEINKSKERETKIIHFIKEKLKTYPNWILVYDNLEKFTDITPYFPSDLEVWGSGKVLVTTRNGNIHNSNYVDHVVPIGPLNSDQKYVLFCKILKQGKDESSPMTAFQNEEIKEFLKEIPPFPLDVSVAAHYLKSTDTPYKQYLESSFKNNKDFIGLQENILKESGDYAKTRYRIITLSIERLMNINKDFCDLLLLISLIDSQNIPRKLLNKYKSNETVDNFIYHLKRYSLIINPSHVSFPQDSTLSFHRSTHAILLNYLKKSLNLESSSQRISSISTLLEHHMREVIENEELSQMDGIKPHLKAFLSHGDLLNDNDKAAIEVQLGCAYYYTHYHTTAKNLLTRSITQLKRHPHQENYQRLSQALSYLGNLHKEVGEHPKAGDLLEEALALYRQHDSQNHIGITRVLTYLGDTYKNLGEHQKARDFLEKSIDLSKKHLDSNQMGVARTMLHLGIVYRDVGEYEKSVSLLKNSLSLFEKYSPENYIERVRALKYLGNTYRSLGRYEEAKSLLTQSVFVSKKYLPENHIALGRSLVHLAVIYKKVGEYKKAKELLMQSLTIHENVFGKDSVRTAWVVTHLASVHQEMGEYERARDSITGCLETYIKSYGHDKLRTSWVFMQLAYVYEGLQDFEKAQEILETALKLHRKHFNENHQKIGEILFHLGNVYKGLGQYKKAHDFLERSLHIYERHYGKDHIETAKILGSLGHLYLCQEDLDRAEATINQALSILQQKQHPSQFLLYETLAKIHLQKATAEENEGRITEAKTFKIQAIKELEQALAIIRPLFPEDSAYVIRIQGKLKSARDN